MKRGLLVLVVLLISGSWAGPASAGAPADPAPAGATAAGATAAVLDWLTRLPDRAGHRVLSGAFGGYSGNTFSLAEPDAIEAATGHLPGVLACDYENFPDQDPWFAIDTSCDSQLEQWWQDGGLVSVSVHAPNPQAGAGLNDKLADFGDLLVPGSAVRTRWLADLDRIAAGLAELDAAGVPVLFRPMHEMNGGSFWWSGQDPATFIKVWDAEYDYLTVTKGLTNLIWVYAPDSNAGNRVAYYPGADRADIVGLSAYTDDPARVDGYEELVALGKPFAFTEVGPATKDGTFDYRRWANAIRTRYPATSYVLSWNDAWSPVRNQHAADYFGDGVLVNPDGIDLSARTVAAGPPVWTGPRRQLAGFEDGLDNWGSYQTKDGPWSVTEWSADGGHALKADVDLAAGDAYLTSTTPLDLSGATALSVEARTAPWGDQAAGTRVKLYIRTGADLAWHDGGETVAGPDGVLLTLPLTGLAQLDDVREMGVQFEPAPGASGGSSIYLDDVAVHLPARLLAGFESGGVDGWQGENVATGPSSATDWHAEGTRSLTAGVDQADPESRLYHVGPTNVAGYPALCVRVRGTGTGKLYAKSPPGQPWLESNASTIGPDGTTLILNLAGVTTVAEVGVYFAPPPAATGRATVYVDDLQAC